MGLHDIDRVETLFSHLSFVPLGTTVDATTVAKNTWPDATPSTNYSDFKLKEIENLKPFQNTETEPRIYVSETAAGWTQEDEVTRKNAGYTFDVARTNTLYKMLQYGLVSLPVAGTPQVPYARKEAYVDGVLLKETGVVSLGEITEIEQVWARLELVNAGDQTNKTARVSLRLTILDADNNTFELLDLA